MLVIAVGLPGTGKSRALRQLVAGRLTRWTTSSAVVHDPNEQWEGGAAFVTVAEARAYIAKQRTVPRLLRITGDTASRVCRLAWDLGTTTCVVDELDTVCTEKRWSDEEKIAKFGKGAAYCLAHYGRHRNVDLFGSFRNTRNVSEDIIGRANFVFVMQHSDGDAFGLQALERRFGKGYAETAVQLQEHECLVWARKGE